MADEVDDDVGTSASSTWDSTEGISAYFVLFSTLLALVIVLSKLLQDAAAKASAAITNNTRVPCYYHLARFLPEAGLILLVGMIAGSILHFFVNDSDYAKGPEQQDNYDDDAAYEDAGVAQSLLSFSPNVFFVALLPPIIFNSGYHLRRELFFRHLLPITLFAVVGTIVSTLCIAFFLHLIVVTRLTGNGDDEEQGPEGGPFVPNLAELLTFGALISATDPVSTLAVFSAKRVDPHLFYLVFGESVLNDAVGVVLFKAFAQFVVPVNGAGKVVLSFGEFCISFLLDAVGSPLLGLFCGVVAAFIFKTLDMRNTKLLELSLYVLIMYVPFLLAELIHLSGIVTILFTGMAARSFVVPNLSLETAKTAESLFRLAAHLAETAIFLELGLSVFGLSMGQNNNYFLTTGKFIGWSILACLLARAVNIYPITFFFNRLLRREQEGSASYRGISRAATATSNIIASALSSLIPWRIVNSDGEADSRSCKSDSDETPRHDNVHGLSSSQIEMSHALAQSDHHQPEKVYHDPASSPSKIQPLTVQRNDTDLSSITPRQERDLKILPKTAHMLWFSGLRGAVAYACVRSFPNTFGHRNEFVLTTMVIVLVTVFFLGGTTELALRALDIDMNVDEDMYMEEWHQQRKQDGIILRFEDFVNRHAVRKGDDSDEDDYDTSAVLESHVSFETEVVGRRRQRRTPDGSFADTFNVHEDSYHHVEITESGHFERLRDTGGHRHQRKKESLFDYGGETR